MYLRSRGIVPEHFYSQRANPLAKMLQINDGGQGNKVDIMRLSHNVRRNLKKEEEEDGQYGS